MAAKHWRVEARPFGKQHVYVTIRCGPKPQDRALLGHLTMDGEEWQQFRHACYQGLPGEIDDREVDYNENLRRLP